MADGEDGSIMDKFSASSVKQFDAFPKLPSTYSTRSDSRGFLTIIIGFVCFLFIIHDIGEFWYGWPEYQFQVDHEVNTWMQINLDMVVSMPCRLLTVDLRDVTGDRMHLSDQFRRDGAEFDYSHARDLELHQWEAQEQQRSVIPKSRGRIGFFGSMSKKGSKIKPVPVYRHNPSDDACRIYGNVDVKKITANLHITTLGHGYQSDQHVPHAAMNLTHMVNELSFGPYFPDIVQPLDGTVALTDNHFEQYQYFITIVPTNYIPARGWTIRTNQYSVTQYHRSVNEGSATPGIFFKFELDPVTLTVHEKTTTFTQFLIRCVGVFGGIWCCLGWAVKVSYKAVEVMTGVKEGEQEIVAVEATGAKKRWGGGELKRRVVKQGNGWVIEGANNEWTGTGTPAPGATFTYSGLGGPEGPGYYSPRTAPLPPIPQTPLPGTGGYLASPRPPMGGVMVPPTPQIGGGFPTGPFPASPFPSSPFPGHHDSPFAAGQAVGMGLGVPATPPPPPRRKDSMASLNGDQTKKDR